MVVNRRAFFMKIKLTIVKHAQKLALLWALIIFLLCATPGQYIPSTTWLELLSFDKWVHASVFFVLTILCFIAAQKFPTKKFLPYLFIILCILYGGLLEVMQAKCFANRSADWYDFTANTFGCLMAFLLSKRVARFIKVE